jgi:hypothetical protein
MNGILFLSLIAALVCERAQANESRYSASAGYTILSQAAIKQKRRPQQISIKIVDRYLDNFSLIYEYAYTDSLKDMDNNQLSLLAHTILVGGQTEPVQGLKVWGALGLALVDGTFRERREAQVESFHSAERSLYFETGFGSAWKISDDYAVGMDWLIVNFDLRQDVTIKEKDALVALKGPFFSLREEVEKSYQQLNQIRSLRMQMSWSF